MNINTLISVQGRERIRIGCLALALLGGESLFATDYTFNTTTGNWGTEATWSPAGTPGAGDNIDMTFTGTNRKLILAGGTYSISNLAKTGTVRWDIVGGAATDSALSIQNITATTGNLIFRNDNATGGLTLDVQNLSAVAGSSTYFGSSTNTTANHLRALTVSGGTTTSGNLFFNIVNDDDNSYDLGLLTVNGTQGVHLNVTADIGKVSTARVTGLSGTGGYIRNSDRAGATNSSSLEINSSTDYSSATVLRNGSGIAADTLDHGTLSLRKLGVGTQTLTGANTYAGTTEVMGGTLLVNGTHIGGGAYTVDGGTLGGTGSITASGVSVADGGKLSAGGAELANLTFSLGAGSLDLSAINTAGSLIFDLGAVGASDMITLSSGTLNIGTLNFSDFSFVTSGAFVGGTFVLFDASSSVVGSILQGSGLIDGHAAEISLDSINHNIVLTVAPIPEPGAFAALAGAGALVVVFGRRRRALV